MQRFTEDETRWMKGRYIQVGLSFRTGTHGKTFFARFETEFPGHIHQEAAWQLLTSNCILGRRGIRSGTQRCNRRCQVLRFFLLNKTDLARRLMTGQP